MYRFNASASVKPVPIVAKAHCLFEYRLIKTDVCFQADIVIVLVGIDVLYIFAFNTKDAFLNNFMTLLAVLETK